MQHGGTNQTLSSRESTIHEATGVRRAAGGRGRGTGGTIVFGAIVAACCERAARGDALDVTLVNFSGRLMRVHAV